MGFVPRASLKQHNDPCLQHDPNDSSPNLFLTMHTLIGAIMCLAAAAAKPLNYGSGGGSRIISGGGSSFIGGGGSSFIGGGGSSFIGGGGSSFIGGGGSGFGGGISLGDGCGGGQVRSGDGGCVTPQVTRNLYLYSAPDIQVPVGASANLPSPKVHLNYVFVRTPSVTGGANAIVAPAPKQKTLVYVLSRRPTAQDQQVLQVDATPTRPEVFFVNYDNGDDTQLPGGVSLQEALSQSIQQGEVIDSGAGGFGGSGISSGGSFVSGGGFSSGGSSFVSDGGFSSGGIISGGSSSSGYHK